MQKYNHLKKGKIYLKNTLEMSKNKVSALIECEIKIYQKPKVK